MPDATLKLKNDASPSRLSGCDFNNFDRCGYITIFHNDKQFYVHYLRPYQDKNENLLALTININDKSKYFSFLIPDEEFNSYQDSLKNNGVEEIEVKVQIDNILINNTSNKVTNEIVTEDMSFQKVRIGQAKFRDNLLRLYNNKCCVTGISDKKFLVASHIIPWRDNFKRTDPSNGLLLYNEIDSFFDNYYVSVKVNNNNAEIITRIVDDEELNNKLNFYKGRKVNINTSNDDLMSYLRVHLNNFRNGVQVTT